jgi:hypothetical protein
VYTNKYTPKKPMQFINIQGSIECSDFLVLLHLLISTSKNFTKRLERVPSEAISQQSLAPSKSCSLTMTAVVWQLLWL